MALMASRESHLWESKVSDWSKLPMISIFHFSFLNSKGEEDKILANIKLSFTPDDDSPSDPMLFLREAIRGASNGNSSKKSDVSGILHGEKVKLVNVTLLTGKFTNKNQSKSP